MSPAGRSRAGRLACAAACVVGVALLAPAPASAYAYALIGDGTSQTMNWFYEYYPPFTSCLTSPGPCVTRYSTEGRLPLFVRQQSRTVSGGMLDWSTSSGSLTVVAMPIAGTLTNSGQWSTAWAAIDVAYSPLIFHIEAEPGDAFPLFANLQITPNMVGTVEQFGNPGAPTSVEFQIWMEVSVEGQIVTRDSLYGTTVSQVVHVWSPAFPKGSSNTVMVSGVPDGAEVSIAVWAYMRSYSENYSQIRAYSNYGQGPAVEIQIQEGTIVGVDDSPPSGGPQLAASPNPSKGTARITYALARPEAARLSLYRVDGSRIITLSDRWEMPGTHATTWDGRDADGRALPPGIYFAELVAGAQRQVAKIVLVPR